MANETARFSIQVDSNAKEVGDDSAKSLLALKDSIQGSDIKIKEMNASLRRLRGDTDEVKKAKDTLNAKIKAERDAISAANLVLIKHEVSVESLTKKERDLALAAKKDAESQSDLRKKLEASTNQIKQTSPLMAALASGAIAAAAAVAALAAALGAGAVSLGKWIVESANMLRSENLAREVMLNSATNAENLGDHIQILAGKVSTARSKLNEYAIELSRTRISGNALVDTLGAMGQASGAGLDDLASKLKEIATRGQLVGRMQLSPQELLGSGLEFTEVADALAKSMGVGVDKAKKALFEGRVKIDDGAKALKLAVEKRFGEINLRRMLDLNVLSAKFKEGMQALTRDVKIEPLLKGLKEIGAAFSINTVEGQALKKLFEDFGGGISETFVKAAPYITNFFQGVIIGALETQIFFYRLRNTFRDTFGATTLGNLVTFEKAMNAGRYAVFGVVGAVAALGVAVAGSIALIAGPYVAAFYGVVKVATFVKEQFDKFFPKSVEQWKQFGSDIVDGLVWGIKAAWNKVKESITGLGQSISKTFRDTLKIQSPSKVFESDGKNIARGVAVGVESEKGKASGAVSGMLDDSRSAAKSKGGSAPVVVNVTINAGGSGGAGVQSNEFMQSLREAIAGALLEAGLSS